MKCKNIKNYKFLMQYILDLLNSYLGLSINLNDNTNPLVLLALSYLIFTCVISFSVVNISIYLLSIYIVNNKINIDKISSYFPYITKIIKYYNSTRIAFILLELLSIIGSLGIMLYLSINIIVKLS